VSNDNLIDEIFGDATAPVQRPSDEALGRVSRLAEEQRRIEREIADLEARLEEKGKDLTRVRTKELPEVMRELGLESFKLVDGSQVGIKREYYASIKEEYRAPAHQWLRGNGHEDLIKNNIVLSLGRGEDEKAAKIEAWCQKQKLAYERKEQVHPMTLKAFVGEQIEKGEDIPHDLLGVHVVDVAKIKPPRAARRSK
jgi:hypothetical protein